MITSRYNFRIAIGLCLLAAMFVVTTLGLVKKNVASAPTAAAAELNADKTPFTDGSVHEGVMGCYGSTCHSRQEATGIVVRQNEILTWQDETSTTSAHVRAYKVLKTERSKGITARLGLKEPHLEPSCLGCHSDNVPESLRGARFQFEDGIGCEACHGGSTNWLSQHYAEGASHSKNVSLGLYPLEDAKTRATVCLSCHLGSEADNQFVTHRMMAAGHPRISFELDLFTALQSHHSEDVDYYERKTVQSGAHKWAIGQVVAMQRQLKLFANPALNHDGAFPELVFFDCLACHRTISDDPDWRPEVRSNPGRPQMPGLVKFNDANMIMLLATAREIAPDMAGELDNAIRGFHSSLAGNGQTTELASATLMQLSETLLTRISATDFSKAQTLNILDTVVAGTLGRRYTDYVAAEQAIMAVDTLLSSMIAVKQVASIDVIDMRDEINRGYDAVERPNDYDQDQLVSALGIIQTRLRELR